MGAIEVKGARRVERALNKLGASAARKAVRPALRAALSPINKAAKRKAKKVTGSLRASLGIKIKLYTSRGVVWGAVGGRFPAEKYARKFQGETRLRKGPFYLHLLEFGTQTAPAQPILRPALDEKRAEAFRILNDKTIAGIEKETRRLAAKAGGR